MSNSQEILPRVRELVAQALETPLDQVTPELEFGGIPAWDSMGHMSIMMLLEEKFGVEIDADMIATLTSVPAICTFVSKE
jgi:acyl carrier protein